MAAWRRLPCLALLLILLVGGETASMAEPLSACTRPLTIRASESYSPFSVKDSNGVAVGIDNVFIAKVMEAVGCEFRFVFLPWKRSLYALKHGQLDVLPSASFTEERSKIGWFSVPYRNELIGFAVRQGDAQALQIDSLNDVIKQNLVIGSVNGAYRGEAFEAFRNSPQGAKHVSGVSISGHGLQLLLADRIDLLLGIPATYIAQAKKQGYGNSVEEHPFVLGREPVRLMFSAKNISSDLVRKISHEIIRQSQTPEYRALYGKHGIGAN